MNSNLNPETRVVNLRHEKCDVKICRTPKNKIPPAPQEGCFGNPFFLKNPESGEERSKVIADYKKYFLAKVELDFAFREAVLSLRGKTLGCFCKQPDREIACHGDIIIEWLEKNVE